MAGPLFLLAVFVGELIAGVRLSMMGVHDEELQRAIFGRFAGLLVRQQVEILAAYLGLGAWLGLMAAAGLSLWDAARGRRPGRARRWLEVGVVVGGVLA